MGIDMKNKAHFLFAAALTLGLALVMGCSSGDDSNKPNQTQTDSNGNPNSEWGKPQKAKFKIPVTVEQVDRGRMYAYLQARGTVVPIKELELKTETTGRIYYTKRWMEGDEVQKGEILARMDDRELNRDIELAELALETAKAEIEPASANLAQAYRDEEFKKAMYERGAIAKYEVDQAILTRIQRNNAYENALKTVRTREMELQKIKQELEKIPIIIPYSGVLLPAVQNVSTSDRSTEETDLTLLNGQTVGSGTVLCRLANIDEIYVALDVPAKDLEDVRIGQQVEIEAYTKSQQIFLGTVSDISTALNSNTRTYTVNVLVDNPNHELRPGMFAKARIITEERLDAISIPRELVLLRNNRQVIFVAKEKVPEEEDLKLEDAAQPGQEDHPRQIAMAGGLENLAAASEENPETENAAVPAKNDPIEYVAEERVVTTGIENREMVEIVDGLREGEYLVVLGYETLTDGVDINITVRDESSFVIDES
ncbi:MAG: efflux RND transporter periplasmic adaptor subunit [Candidatus Hinthialibacter sp.]